MKKSYNKAFTLVELLAVIVILAIILVIAVPKIMDVINSSKKSTLETSVKMIASTAEKTKMQNTILGKEEATITCDSVAKLSSSDYDLSTCKITFTNSTAKVTVKGKGKFDGLYVCGGTKSQATAQTEMCATDGSYFNYEFIANVKDSIIAYVEVKNVNKCITFFNKIFPDEEIAQTCNGTYNGYTIDYIVTLIGPYSDYEEAGLDVKWKKVTVEDESKCAAYLSKKFCEGDDGCARDNLILCSDGTIMRVFLLMDGVLPTTDYEEAGLKMSDAQISITGYNTEGGLEVIIPSTIDNCTVSEIGQHAFYNIETGQGLGIKSVLIPSSVTSVGKYAFSHNELQNVLIPNSVTSIGDSAFSFNPLSKVELSNPNIEIGNCAFGDKKKIPTHNLPDTCDCRPQ